MGLILVAGMRRSGSTVAFQIALELAGGKEHSLGFDSVKRFFRPYKNLMVGKTHSFWKQAEDDKVVAINTYRDPRDIAISMMGVQNRTFAEVVSHGLLNHAVYHQELWEKSKANRHEARYEDFVDDLISLVYVIAQAMKMNISWEKANKIADKFSLKRNRQRADVAHNMRPDLLFPGHIRDGSIGQWQGQLSGQQLEQIYEFAGDWMRKRAYL